MKKFALPATLRPGQLAAVADADRGRDQRAGIEIEHRLGVGLVAGGRIVAAQHQEIADAERGGAEQVALQRQAVAVAAGQLEHRLDAVLPQDRRRGERAQMRTRAGAVGDIDGIGQALERQRLGEQLVRSQVTGGVTSAVMTNRPDASAFSSCPLAGFTGGISGFLGCWTAWS